MIQPIKETLSLKGHSEPWVKKAPDGSLSLGSLGQKNYQIKCGPVTEFPRIHFLLQLKYL